MSAGMSQGPPALLISVRYQNEVRLSLQSAGYSVVVADWREDPELAFRQSLARVIIVDARGARHAGLSLIERLNPAATDLGAALVVLASAGDLATIEDALRMGATHFLIAPIKNAELAIALRYADRFAERLLAAQSGKPLSIAPALAGDLPRWDLTFADREVSFSPELRTLLGPEFVEPRISWRRALQATTPDTRRALIDQLRAVTVSGAGTALQRVKIRGRQRSLLHHIRLRRHPNGDAAGLVASVEEQLQGGGPERLTSHFDTLTGLANPTYARTWLMQQFEDEQKFDPVCAIVQVAISRFSQINGAYGRVVAEHLLQAVARRLRRAVPLDIVGLPERLLARLGGTEFALLLGAPITQAEAVFLAQPLADAFSRPFVVDGQVIHLSCRVGVAVAEAGLADPELLFRRSDAAISRARSLEPNSVQVFTAGDEQYSTLMVGLETDLRRVVSDNALEILFQPQIEIATDHMVGVEALVRWRHPSLGLVGPETMLTVADNAEIALELGQQILRRAMHVAAGWTAPALTHLRVSINVSAGQLQQRDFAALIARLLGETGFSASRLTLELTESSLMEDVDAASATIDQIRRLGVRVALDDFGTGYSSLAYLKALPFDYLKVDRRFVSDIMHTGRDQIVVHSVIEMARSLGMSVIAEGVETETQLEHLVREGCTLYQGYLCSPPLSSAHLEDFSTQWAQRRGQGRRGASKDRGVSAA